MMGNQIIAGVLDRTGVSAEDFFGQRRARKLTEARVEAILELTTLGLSASAIGRIMGRNHVTVLYWQRPEMRAERKAAYAATSASRPRPERKPRKQKKARAKRVVVAKTVRHRCFYTQLEDATARSLFARGAGTEECRRLLGRDRDSVRKRIRRLDDPAYRERCQQADRNRNLLRKQARAAIAQQVPKDCEPMFKAASVRACAPRSLTASLLGDPAPGFSALDLRNATEARV